MNEAHRSAKYSRLRISNLEGLPKQLANSATIEQMADEKDEKLYQSVYIGSGTFIISKPKRKSRKLRQSRVKSPQRGARK
jgi:hypothetical protein